MIITASCCLLALPALPIGCDLWYRSWTQDKVRQINFPCRGGRVWRKFLVVVVSQHGEAENKNYDQSLLDVCLSVQILLRAAVTVPR